jgi:hypothetical protein
MEQINPQQQIVPPVRPKNWLVESILVTIFCCLPFGVAGIIFAAQVNSKYDAGDYEGAVKSSADAGRWTKIGFFAGLAINILVIITWILIGSAALFSSGALMQD